MWMSGTKANLGFNIRGISASASNLRFGDEMDAEPIDISGAGFLQVGPPSDDFNQTPKDTQPHVQLVGSLYAGHRLGCENQDV